MFRRLLCCARQPSAAEVDAETPRSQRPHAPKPLKQSVDALAGIEPERLGEEGVRRNKTVEAAFKLLAEAHCASQSAPSRALTQLGLIAGALECYSARLAIFSSGGNATAVLSAVTARLPWEPCAPALGWARQSLFDTLDTASTGGFPAAVVVSRRGSLLHGPDSSAVSVVGATRGGDCGSIVRLMPGEQLGLPIRCEGRLVAALLLAWERPGTGSGGMSKDDSGDGTQPCLDFAWSELSELLRLAQFVGFGLFSDPQQAAYLEQLACLLCNMARGMLAGVHELLTAALEGLPPLLAGRFGLALQPLLAAVTSSAAPALVFARRPGGVGAVSSGQVPHIPLLGESRSNSNRRKPHALAREESMGGGAWRPSADLLADVAVAGNSVSGWAVPGSGPQGLGRVKAVRTALAHTLLQRALRETTRGGSQPQVTLPSPLPPAAAPTAASATSTISFNSRPQPATIVLADASGAALEEAGPGRDVLLAANLTGVSAVAALLLIAEAPGLYGHGMMPGGLGGAFVPGIGSARVRNDSALLPSPSAPLPLLPASTTVAPAAPQPHAVSYVEANGSNAQGMAGGVARVVESFALSLSQQPSPRRTRDGSIGPQVPPRSRIGAPALTAHGGTDGPSLQAAFTSLPGGDVAAGASPRAAANGSSHHHHQVQSFPAAAGSVLPKSPSMNSSLASGPAHASASLTASAPAPFRLALYLVSPESVPTGVLDAVAAEMKVLAPLLFDAFHAALDAGGLAAAEWSSLQGQLMQRCPTTGQLPSHGSIDAAGTTGPGAYGPPHPHSAHPAHVMPSGSSLAPHSPRRGSGSDVASPVPRRGELGGSGSRLRLMSGAENNAATAESGGRRVSRHQTLHGGAPGPGGPGPGPSLDPLRNPDQALLLSESNAGVGGGTRGAAGEGVDEDVLGELLMETQMEDLEGVGRDTVEAYNRAGWSAHPHGRKASRASCLMMSSPLIKLEDVSGPRPLELMVTSARSRLTAVATGGEAGEETRLAVAQDLAAVELLEVVGSGGQGVVFRGSLHGLEAAIKVWEHGARAPLEHDGDGLSGGVDDDDVDAASAASPRGGDRKDAAAAARADEATQAGSSSDCIRQAKRGAMEVAVTCTLSHPNIVQTYAHFSDVVVVERQTALTAVLGGAPQLRLVAHDDPIFRGGRAGPLNTVLCLEYCDAGTLLSAARRGDFRLPGSGPRDGPVWPDLVPLVTSLLEVALALRYLHARRLVHCDLKPGNVLLKTNSRDPRGWTCKLSDFGCVRLMDDFGTDGSPGFRMAQVFGTVAYMAPECFGRGRLLNAAVDVYAFGILMWELLHCLAPHSKADPKDLPRQVVRHGLRPEFHPLAPPEFSALAARCWAPQPERRPTATQLVAQLQQLLGVARSVASRQRQGGRAHQSAAQTPPLQLQPQPQGVPSPMPQQTPPAKLASPLPSQQRSPPPRQQPSPQPPGPGQAAGAGPGPGQAQGLVPGAQLLMAQPPPHVPVPGTQGQGQGLAPKDLLRFPSSSLGSRPQLQPQPQPLPHAHSHQPHHHLGGAPRLAERVVVGQAQLAQAAAQQRQAAEAAAAQAGVNGMGAGAGARAGLGLGLPQSSVGGGVGGGGSWDGQPLPRNAPLGAGGGSRRRPQSVDAPGCAAHLALGAPQPAQLRTPQQPEPHLRQQQQQPKALSGGQVAAFVNAARAPVIPGPGARAQTVVPNGSGELSLT